MSGQRLEQTEQVYSSRLYDDNRAAGAVMEALAHPADSHLENDLNNIRTILAYLRDGTGVIKWYVTPEDSFGVQQIHDKVFVEEIPPQPGLTDFVLVAPALGVLLPDTLFPAGTKIVGVGPSSLINEGYATANEALFAVAGVLGVGLSVSVDGRSVLLNRCSILDADTNDHPEAPGGEQVFGLLQVVNGTADGAAIGVGGSENVQMSFVYYDKATDLLTAFSLPLGTYHFSLPQQLDFYTLNRGVFLGGGALPTIIDPGSNAPRLPFKEFDITAGGNIAAGDPLDIATGVFTGAGARTTLAASFGTIALPANGPDFRDDSRIEAWYNGQNLSKWHVAPGPGQRDVWWVSPTQVAFNFVIKQNTVLKFRMPSAY